MLSSQLALTVLLVSLSVALATAARKPQDPDKPKNYEIELYLTNLLKYYEGANKPAAEIYGINKSNQEKRLARARLGESVLFSFSSAEYEQFKLIVDNYKLLVEDYAEVVERNADLAFQACENAVEYEGEKGESYVEFIVNDLITKTGVVLTRHTIDLLLNGQKPKGKIVRNEAD